MHHGSVHLHDRLRTRSPTSQGSTPHRPDEPSSPSQARRPAVQDAAGKRGDGDGDTQRTDKSAGPDEWKVAIAVVRYVEEPTIVSVAKESCGGAVIERSLSLEAAVSPRVSRP
jgi:hypothetical protein